MSMHITGINLFDHNVGMVCAKVRFRSSFISMGFTEDVSHFLELRQNRQLALLK